jgi:hypothetical protein
MAPRSSGNRARTRSWVRRGVIAAAIVVTAVACTGSEDASPRPSDGSDRPPDQALQAGEPYPYDQPAPPRQTTPIDGSYARRITIEQAGGRPVYCRRCAPYRRDAGRYTLAFEEGRFRVRFTPVPPGPLCADCLRPPGFAAIGHYRVSGDRLTMFNDPNCTHTTGVYGWSLEEARLRLDEVDDPCPYDRLRAKFLTATEWLAADTLP